MGTAQSFSHKKRCQARSAVICGTAVREEHRRRWQNRIYSSTGRVSWSRQHGCAGGSLKFAATTSEAAGARAPRNVLADLEQQRASQGRLPQSMCHTICTRAQPLSSRPPLISSSELGDHPQRLRRGRRPRICCRKRDPRGPCLCKPALAQP